jgi:hypothetical protein
MDAPILLTLAILAHTCKPLFRERARRTNGRIGVALLAAIVYALLSVASLGATLLALWTIIF